MRTRALEVFSGFGFSGSAGGARGVRRHGITAALGFAALLGSATLGVGCADAPEPVSSEDVARGADALARPYETERKVIANRVTLRMTGNFFAPALSLQQVDTSGGAPSLPSGVVALPATSSEDTDSLEVSPDGGSHYTFTKRVVPGMVPQPIQLWVGKTCFVATERIDVFVLGGKQNLTLDTLAEGDVFVVEDGNRWAYRSVRFYDGRIQPGEPIQVRNASAERSGS
jgi:hypothetical protein